MAAALFWCVPAPAQTPVPRAGAPSPPARPEELIEDQRQVVAVAGFSLYQLLGVGAGLSVGVEVAPKTFIDVEAYKGYSVFQESESVALRVQYFVRSAFHLRGGIRARHVDINDITFGDRDSDVPEGHTVQSDLGLDLGIGSRWARSAFTVGVEWVGLYIPVVAVSTERRLQAADNGEIFEEGPADFTGRVDFRVTYLYVGAVF